MFEAMSVKWKILLIALLGPVVVAVIMAWLQVRDIRLSAEDEMLQQARVVTLMAEAVREEMGQKLENGVIRPLDQISPEHIMEAVPVVSAMSTAARNAEKGDYTFRAPKVSPRNPANTPTPVEASALKRIKSEGLPELVIREANDIRYFRPVRLTRDCLYCHGDPKGSKDPTGGIREGWKEGQIHGAFEIVQSMDEANARVLNAELSVAGGTVAILAVVFALSWYVARQGVIDPLQRIQAYAREVAEGGLDAEPKGRFGAELARLKEAIHVMVSKLKEKMGEAQAKSEEARREAERASEAMRQSQAQEARAKGLLDTMTKVADEASQISHQVSSASEELSAQVDLVSRGADVQRQRAEQTATAMEEMNATVMEVARSSGSTAESAEASRAMARKGEAVVEQVVKAVQNVNDRTRELKEEMSGLGEKANDINKILDVITDIADQTNLLALNAAIEAARAGEAGRGFAVVADEVRKLAEKTMSATKEVHGAITAIQESAHANIESMDLAAAEVQEATALAQESGAALEEIVRLANDTSDQMRSIATAAEQQASASEEINRAIEDINQITAENAQGTTESAQAVTDLARLALKLQGLIDDMGGGGNA